MFVKCKPISREDFRQIIISNSIAVSSLERPTPVFDLGENLRKKYEQACTVIILFSKERNKSYNSNYQLEEYTDYGEEN